MKELLHYATDVKVEAYMSPGKFFSAIYMTEQCHRERMFLPQPISDEFKEACNSKSTTIYKLIIEVVSKHGKPSYSTEWRYTPRFTDFWVGFLGTSLEEVVQAALVYCKENTDHSLEPQVYERGSYTPVVQPLVIRTETYPHYLDDKNV